MLEDQRWASSRQIRTFTAPAAAHKYSDLPGRAVANLDRRMRDEPSDTRTEPLSGADAGAVLIKTQAVHIWSICTLGDYWASAAQTARV
jgi:hypothetical protein